jgi:predicted metalloprotease with PDZ domain
MYIRYLLFVAFLLSPAFSQSQSKSRSYEYTIDLTRVVDDRVRVELRAPSVSGDEVTFYMPRIIPGTYAIADYGRYVHDLEATDKKGKKLPVERVDQNTWKIKNAGKLTKVSYWVDDTFDTAVEGPEIFWPAGTNIEEGKNFVINASGFFGYFEGMKRLPFRVNILRDPRFYGSTGLMPLPPGAVAKIIKPEKNASATKAADVFETRDYDELVDSPIMYSLPDTALIRVANTEVLIGSYAPNKSVTAKEIAASIREVLQAQASFLGGDLPVNKYAFIFYFTGEPVMSYGALEHSYSSFYYMPEMPIEDMNQQLRDFAAHEFFHIVTPLTVHSEHIKDFDFNDPKMSRHLWMYEGVTEYFAGNVQVKYGLITPQEYLAELHEKMLTADQFIDDVPFTDISRFTLDKYHDQYYNVYQKGALIGLCLDIRLRKLSKGQYSLRQLMLDLSKQYGKEKAFKDDELFDIITRMTYPEIGEFFNRHVAGSEPLPLEEVLHDAGILYKEEQSFEDYSMGIANEDIGIVQVGSKPKLQIASTAKQNAMGKVLGFREGDVLVGINGETMPDLGPELGAFLQRHYQALPQTDTLSYTVLRTNENGETAEVTLSAPVQKIPMTRRHLMQFDPMASEEQLKVRESWLSPEH